MNRIRKNKKGQMLLVFALTWALLLAGILLAFNTGTLVGERIRLQQISDNAAYSGAVWQARCLNYLAYCNRAIVADLAFIAYLNAVVSHFDCWEEVIGYLSDIASLIPVAGAIISAILTTVQQVMDAIDEIVKEIKDSGVWEIVMESIYWSQTLYVPYTEFTTDAVMKQIASEADPDVTINSGFSAIVSLLNFSNFQALYKDAKGEGEKIRDVTNQTLSAWTKGEDEGMIPIANRDWYAFPEEIEDVIKYLSIAAGTLPGNVIIDGSVELNDDGIKTTDQGSVRMWYFKWPTFWSPSTGYRSYNVPISMEHVEERDVDWDDIGFYNFKDSGPKSAGVYAVAAKTWESMPAFIFREMLGGTFAGTEGALSVPKNDLKTISKAITTYEDPEPGSARWMSLKAANKDPNLWNPFWHAELVAINHNESGVSPDEDADENNSEVLLDFEFGALLSWDWKQRVSH